MPLRVGTMSVLCLPTVGGISVLCRQPACGGKLGTGWLSRVRPEEMETDSLGQRLERCWEGYPSSHRGEGSLGEGCHSGPPETYPSLVTVGMAALTQTCVISQPPLVEPSDPSPSTALCHFADAVHTWEREVTGS